MGGVDHETLDSKRREQLKVLRKIVTSLTFPPEDYDHSVPEILSPIFTLFLMANIG